MKLAKFRLKKVEQKEEGSFTDISGTEFIWEGIVPKVGESVLISDGTEIWIGEWKDISGIPNLEPAFCSYMYWAPLPN